MSTEIIRSLENGDLPAAKEVWLASFVEDPPEFPDYYFRARTSPERMLALFERGDGSEGERLLSMLCYDPVKMQLGGEETVQAAFVAGVCTMPEARRRGYVRRLLDELALRLEGDGFAALLLVPFDFDFYRKLGFYSYARRRLVSFSKADRARLDSRFDSAAAMEPDPAMLNSIYSRYMQKRRGALVRDEAYFGALLEEYSGGGGHALAVRADGGEAYCLFNDAEPAADEFAYTSEAAACALIAAALEKSEGLRLPLPLSDAPAFIEGARCAEEDFNMLRPLKKSFCELEKNGAAAFDFRKY